MAAPRATQFIALRNLSRTAHSRQLHMTGPATYASSRLTSERPNFSLPRDLASLRAECQRRNLDSAGSEQELRTRLEAEHVSSSRAFSSAARQRRPSPPAPKVERQFNTSRSLHAVNDSSPIDLVYFPADVSATTASSSPSIAVPILPSFSPSPVLSGSAAVTSAPVVMRPEISTMSAETVCHPLAEVADGHALNVDFHALAEKVAEVAREKRDAAEGLVARIWSDVLDDLVGGTRRGSMGKAGV